VKDGNNFYISVSKPWLFAYRNTTLLELQTLFLFFSRISTFKFRVTVLVKCKLTVTWNSNDSTWSSIIETRTFDVAYTCMFTVFVLYNKETGQLQIRLFISKSFNITRKLTFAHFCEHKKKPFHVTCSDWSRKIMPIMYLEAIWFKFWMEGALVMVEICVICVWWFSDQVLLSNLFTVANSPINPDKTKVSCNTPYRCSTTVSLVTYPLTTVYMTWKNFPAYLKDLWKYRRMAFFFLKYLFSFQRYLHFSIMQISSVSDDSFGVQLKNGKILNKKYLWKY